MCSLGIGSYHVNDDETSAPATTSKTIIDKAQTFGAQKTPEASRQEGIENIASQVEC